MCSPPSVWAISSNTVRSFAEPKWCWPTRWSGRTRLHRQLCQQPTRPKPVREPTRINHIPTTQPYQGTALMKKEMLINVAQPEESRIAIMEDGPLDELYIERKSVEAFAGNIYRGKIVNLEPSIQAAFVDFGVGRNGFLHV